MLDTRGNLDQVRIDGDTLKLEGWAAAVGAGAIEDFKVTCGGREVAGHELEARLPSPDVKAVHPSLDEANRCRFRLRARLDDGAKSRARNSVITCTPRAAGAEGRALMHLIEPIVPAPSAEDITYVGGGFLEVSSEFLGYFIQLADLRPDSAVLDVGCGVGRMAYMLAHYLGPEGRYEGFDIVERLIGWAQRSITPHAPNFTFQRANIYNKYYNPGGAFTASEFRFPYEDESFDFLFLTSVFTHMMAADVRHYLDEFRRVLRPGGHCLTTCFLLNDESEALIREGRTTQKLAFPLEDCFTTNPDVPEDAIGYKEPLLLDWIADRGFTLRSKHYGFWCDRPRSTSYQDILVYKKTAA